MAAIGSLKIIDQNVLATEAMIEYVRADSDELISDKETTPDPFYQDHFRRTKEAICRAFEGLKRRALVVGVGAAQDIPLEELAMTFDKVRLVDIDLRYIRKAIELLPEELQGKFELEEADICGFLAELSQKAEELIAEKVAYREFVKRILDLLPTLRKEKYAYQENEYDFVCSALVGSQIGGVVFGYLDAISKRAYGVPFVPPERKDHEIARFMNNIQIDHLKELFQLTRPDGRVYFADHYSLKKVVFLRGDMETSTEELERIPLPGAQEVQAAAQQIFCVLSKEYWNWGLPTDEWIEKKLRAHKFIVYKISSFVFSRH
ncbi:MAG: hypothetical protein K1X28_08385 [Parachlamydiales bacterium]|nr:hypothetical protein [Parachlamydiales bacterium]